VIDGHTIRTSVGVSVGSVVGDETCGTGADAIDGEGVAMAAGDDGTGDGGRPLVGVADGTGEGIFVGDNTNDEVLFKVSDGVGEDVPDGAEVGT